MTSFSYHHFRTITRSLFLIAIAVFLSTCEKEGVQPNQSFNEELTLRSGLPTSAYVVVGDEKAGSPFPPPANHDRSYHAKDKLVPRTVTIAAGGTVHYEIMPFHQIGIYEPGTQPKDINLALTEDLTVPIFIPDFIINDPDDRLALSPFMLAETTWTSPSGTFDKPGRYLVICTITPHFVNADMYGWVIVK